MGDLGAAVLLRGGLRGQIAHHVLAAGAGAARKPAGEDLRHRREVGPDAELFLSAAGRHAEAGDDLVEDQQHVRAPGLLAKRGDEGRRRRHRAEVTTGRLDDHRGHVALREPRAHRADVIGRQHGDEIDHLGKLAGLGLGLVGRAHADLEPLVPAVEVAGELDDVTLARERAGQPHGHVGGLGARSGEAHALGARHEPAHPLAPLDFLLVTRAVVGAAQRLLAHGLRHLSRIVPQEQRAMAHPVVDIAVAVDVPLVGAVGAGDIERERLHAAVVVSHRVGEEAPGALIQRARGGQCVGVAVLELGRSGEAGHGNLL